MRPFMSNPCGHLYCKRTDCENCSAYKPMFYSIKVPRWLAEILYVIEFKLISKRGGKI